MDPLTAGLQLANGIVTLLTKAFDAADAPTKAQIVKDFAQPIHNCSEFLQQVQAQVNQAVKPQ